MAVAAQARAALAVMVEPAGFTAVAVAVVRSLNGSNSGAGGNGANGIVIVISE